MQKLKKKQIKESVAVALTQALVNLQVTPSKKIKKLLTNSVSEITKAVHTDMKVQEKKIKRRLRKKINSARRKVNIPVA